jgi:Family of unknown function (DUF5678)
MKDMTIEQFIFFVVFWFGVLAVPFLIKMLIDSSNRRLENSPENQWLRKNADTYSGQWVALTGNQLVAHGHSASEVFTATRPPGIIEPRIFFVGDQT